MKIYPLALTLALAAAMVAARLFAPVHGFLLPSLSVPGALLMAVGMVLVLWSAGLFRRRKTTLNPVGEPTALTTEGLYRLSRNPMYVGMLLGLLGLALFLGDAWCLLAPAFFAAVTARQIRREEIVLEKIFGEAYRNYRVRVRRWL